MKNNKVISKGLAFIAILLFMGLVVSPSIYADRGKVSFEPIIENDSFDYDGYTPIQLVFFLINRLCNYKDIQDIESEDDVLEIIDSDAELNDIVVKLKSFDCGCGDDSSEFRWRFPVICMLLLPFRMISFAFLIKFDYGYMYLIMGYIDTILNCFWV